jgi:hypothetical protein
MSSLIAHRIELIDWGQYSNNGTHDVAHALGLNPIERLV